MKLKQIQSKERLEQVLLLRILSGEFNEKPLPSQRELCAEYGLCRATVSAVVDRLTGRGLCVSSQGLGVNVVPLIQSLDHKLLLELIKNAEQITKAMEMMDQLLALVRKLLVDAASAAAEKRAPAQVEALREIVHEVSFREPDPERAAKATSIDEYNVWRIVAGASGSIGTTTALNGLGSLWLDSRIFKVPIPTELVDLEALVAAISLGDSEAAQRAASRVLEPRERVARAALPNPSPEVVSLAS
jgi:DNA-binding FadR family transcriptional regulator